MQYILSEDEMADLKATRKYELDLSTKKLQELCTKVCNGYVLDKGWRKGHVWGCILNDKGEIDSGKYGDLEWYCDDCIMKTICPYPHKHWSK